MEDQLNAYMEQERMYHVEGETGVAHLAKIVGVLGYDGDHYKRDETMIAEFLADNSGAMEAIVNWIGEQNVPEWKENLTNAIREVDDELA